MPSDARLSGTTASWFLIAALVALLLVPLAIHRHAGALRTELEELAEPARDLIAEIQFSMARETSTLRAYLITGSAEYLEEFERLAERQRALHPRLEGLAAQLSPEALAHAVELRTLSEEWHERVRRDEIPVAPVEPLDAESPLEQDLYVRRLEAASRAELALRDASAERRDEVGRIERIGEGATVFLALIALGGVGVVLSLGGRIRRLAAEAHTRRTEVEEALEEAARALEARADLIRGFTHDVKNPLGAADGFAELLEVGLRGELTPAQAETVARIRRSIHGATEIIDELLDLSRLESGGLKPVREDTDLKNLLVDTVTRHSGAAAAAGIDLQLLLPDGDLRAYLDPARVKQVLDNLITNAVKYTPPEGGVVVDVQLDGTETPPHEGNWLAIRVCDTGPGIPEEEKERIFDEFHRVPGTRGKGHGLGLAISRRIARILGGEVTVRSVLGQGSTFILWLPVRSEGDGPVLT